ncbi:SpaA isopeptide-forming pilin-related protein [Streptomyces sp. NPDC096323]|uniref:MSCRAMM family protein n=1 Tax=Streptomyces sp. NPDC096323 TaxID=3155822 RepID=UPI003326FD2A
MSSRSVTSPLAVRPVPEATMTVLHQCEAMRRVPTACPTAPAPDTGSVEITTKDPVGDVLPGAAFLLLDSAGQEAGHGKTDAQGKLTFPDLSPGVYRLNKTASGTPIHEAVADQDVIVTLGATTRLTITDPFKAAKVLLQAKDDKTGTLLPGATVSIGTGTSTLLTLTTGTKGTASGELPVSSRKMQFWAKEIKASAGYDLYKPTKTFTAGPGAPVTVTVTNAKAATHPKPDPSDKPTDKPTHTPSTPGTPSSGSGETTPTVPATGTPEADSSTPTAVTPGSNSTSRAPVGSLAHTGADATPWLIGSAGVLIVVGAGVLAMTGRRRADESTDDSTES